MLDIGMNLAVLADNVAKLQQRATDLPTPAEVRAVDGGGSEPAETEYTGHLREVAAALAENIVLVRDFVTANAEALEKAAQALGETDAAGDQAATQATSFIDSVVSASPPAGGAGAPRPGTPAGNGSGTGGGEAAGAPSSTGTTF